MSIMGRTRLACAAICLAGATAQAADLVELKVADGAAFRETVGERLPVSSTSVVGMLALPKAAAGTPDPSNLSIFLPRRLEAGDKVRVEIESADGRYRGSGVFEGVADAGSWVRAPLLSDGEQSVRPGDLKVDELAVSVRLFPADKSAADTRLVATWESQVAAPERIRLHVNGRRAIVSLKFDASANDACRRVVSGSTRVFDYVCDVPLDRLGRNENGDLQLMLTRVDGFAREQIPVVIPLLPR